MTNSTEAVKDYRERQAELGRKPKQFYLTEDEWVRLKFTLKNYRENQK